MFYFHYAIWLVITDPLNQWWMSKALQNYVLWIEMWKNVKTNYIIKLQFYSCYNQCLKLNQKCCRSWCLESQIIKIKWKKNKQKVLGPPPKLSALDLRTLGNFQHWLQHCNYKLINHCSGFTARGQNSNVLAMELHLFHLKPLIGKMGFRSLVTLSTNPEHSNAEGWWLNPFNFGVLIYKQNLRFPKDCWYSVGALWRRLAIGSCNSYKLKTVSLIMDFNYKIWFLHFWFNALMEL